MMKNTFLPEIFMVNLLHNAAAVYCAIMKPELRPLFLTRKASRSLRFSSVILALATGSAILSMEALGATRKAFTPWVLKARDQPGQAKIGNALYTRLAEFAPMLT